MFTLIKFLNKLSDEDRVAGLKFLISSLRNSANEGCEKIWSELRSDYASGTSQSQRFNNNFVDEFDDAANELKLVQWSIGRGLNERHCNYKVSGQFNHSLIPCGGISGVANARRQRDRTLIFETKFQQLMQLFLYRVNCPVYRNFVYKENEQKQVVLYVERGQGSGGASVTELLDDNEPIDDQSTQQTDDIMDDDSQTGDASVVDDGGHEQTTKDDQKPNLKRKKPRHKAKITSWSCFQCPKV